MNLDESKAIVRYSGEIHELEFSDGLQPTRNISACTPLRHAISYELVVLKILLSINDGVERQSYLPMYASTYTIPFHEDMPNSEGTRHANIAQV